MTAPEWLAALMAGEYATGWADRREAAAVARMVARRQARADRDESIAVRVFGARHRTING